MPYFSSDVLCAQLIINELKGKLITRWGEANFSLSGSFFAAYVFCADPKGDFYVEEALKTISGQIFGKLPLEESRIMQKFKRTKK